jgi:hypothetical protein
MTIYRERLVPGPWVFISTALIIPAALLVFLPINEFVGVVAAIVLYTACVAMLLLFSPVVEVTTTTVIAGRARLPMQNVGETTGYTRTEATAERGQRLDARAWLVIRGWVDPVIKIQVNDDRDPVPYWLVSTRHPDAVIRAIDEARTHG